jgi:hypothetical protein
MNHESNTIMNLHNRKLSLINLLTSLFFLVGFGFPSFAQKELFVDAESFAKTGGWVVDQQSWDVIGSSYLLAHGMGRTVLDAETLVQFPAKGKYHVWVRTRDWAAYPTGPGAFDLLINNQRVENTFGVNGNSKWNWEYGGVVTIRKTNVLISLRDLTGFEGRCDAIYFSTEKNPALPNTKESIDILRKKMLNIPEKPKNAGEFDFVVTGGGMAGTCAAIAAARMGLKVALIQDRPVLGGNNSSEVRVHLVGRSDQNLYPKLGGIVRELGLPDQGNANPDGNKYGDDHKEKLVRAEKNIALFLSTHACGAEKDGNRIIAVIARDVRTNQEMRFPGKVFADCTGDGTIGYLAGADFFMGRENKEVYNESFAPAKTDSFTLGTSNLWVAKNKGVPSGFPQCPWALQFSDEYHIDRPNADWEWETGFGNLNTIYEAEQVRDHNFRAIYGNWAYLKNHKNDKYANYELDWVSYTGGKRESRRLLGDHILTQNDIDSTKFYIDAFVTGTWTIDLHFPDPKNSKFFPGQEFMSATNHIKRSPYHIPYRCFYSRNIDNLFMAGRDISASHVAFGSTRVMVTSGMMGELVGIAASLCVNKSTTPRGIYQDYLIDLINQVK